MLYTNEKHLDSESASEPVRRRVKTRGRQVFFVRAGHSFFETIIYVSILTVVSIFVVGSALSIYTAFGKTQIDHAISQNGAQAMETMIHEIRQATSVDVAGSTFGVSPGTLVLGIKKFSLVHDAIKMQEGTHPAQEVTSGVVVTSLVFYRDTIASSDIVKIEMKIESGEGIFSRRTTFFGSAVIGGAH